MREIRKKYRLDGDKLIMLKGSDTEEQNTKERYNPYEIIGLATDLGFTVAIPIAAGAILGSMLDNKFATSPKITLSLLFFGLIISFLSILKIMKRYSD